MKKIRFLFEQITQIEIKIWTNIIRKFSKETETSLCTNTSLCLVYVSLISKGIFGVNVKCSFEGSWCWWCSFCCRISKIPLGWKVPSCQCSEGSASTFSLLSNLCANHNFKYGNIMTCWFFNWVLWSNGLVSNALDSQFRDPVYKNTRWLQGWFFLSSFREQSNEYQQAVSRAMIKNIGDGILL